MSKKYAIIQDCYEIWGDGDTVDECIENANEYLDEPISMSDLVDRTHGWKYAIASGDLYITDDEEDILKYDKGEHENGNERKFYNL